MKIIGQVLGYIVAFGHGERQVHQKVQVEKGEDQNVQHFEAHESHGPIAYPQIGVWDHHQSVQRGHDKKNLQKQRIGEAEVLRQFITEDEQGAHDQQGADQKTHKRCGDHFSFFLFLCEEPEEGSFHSIGQQGVEIGRINKIDRVFGIFFRSQGMGVKFDKKNVDGPWQNGCYAVDDGIFEKAL